jgi:hypothetical protein
MTTAQRVMLFRFFSQAMARAGVVGTVARELERERITVKVFGGPRSWSTFNNRDVDRMKGTLLAILRPADLDAQVKQIEMPRTRLLTGIRESGYPRHKVETIAADEFGTRDFESLLEHDLENLHRTVINRARSQRRHQTVEAPF